jgi:putative FmdB family regulatory protein
MLYYDFRAIPEEMFVPLYEYLCPKCGHKFEKIENVSAPEKRKCPKCGAKAERTISSPAIQFKGSGWYVTDYGGKSSGSDSSKTEEKKKEKAPEPAKPAPAKEATPKSKDK